MIGMPTGNELMYDTGAGQLHEGGHGQVMQLACI